MRAKHGDSVTAGGQTDPTRPQLEDRALRECCANAIVVSCMTLDDQHHGGRGCNDRVPEAVA
eukprot:4141844-Alexandrium_andersonii.AAC.1